jgi:DNA-binding transcriptional ArsR family regulator
MSSISSEPSPGHGWTPQQWQAVSSPHRLQLLLLLTGLKEATVHELAELSGRTAQSLYPHLDALVDADFLVVREPAETGRRSRIYVCGPASMVSPVDASSGRGNRDSAELAALMLHDACARLRRFGSIAEGVPVGEGAERTVAMHSELTWLDDARRRRVNELMQQLMTVVMEGRSARVGRRTNVLLYHFPDVTLREARLERDGANNGATDNGE